MSPRATLGCIACVLLAAHLWADGPVAEWRFDKGRGDLARDGSGNNNHANIHGARWVKSGKGYALRFDGVDDYVDCGRGASLDIRDAISLEVCVYPEGTPQGGPLAEPGIAGKHFKSYLLSHFKNGKCYWYIGGGGNSCSAALSPAGWTHVVCTFDGTALKLYLNGEQVADHRSKRPSIDAGGNFFIGCVVGNPAATDPSYAKTSYFKGMIDDVSVYNRALSAEEVWRRYKEQAGRRAIRPAVKFSPVKRAVKLRAEGFMLTIGKTGAMQVDVGKEAYVIESSFSYPGDTIGKNALSVKPPRGEPDWRPKLKRTGRRSARLRATGALYSLERQVRVAGHRIEIEDTLTNRSDAPIGIMIRNAVTARQVFHKPHLAGTAENPAIFLPQEASRLGLIAEDTVARLQLDVTGFSNQAGFEVNHFALDARKSYAFKWAIYPFGPEADYFTFINKVREDWNTNFTIDGPSGFFGGRNPLLDDPAGLKAFLTRKKLAIVGLHPWLDYSSGSNLTRADTKRILQRAVAILRKTDPAIKCLGLIETDWVCVRPPWVREQDLAKLPRYEGVTKQVLLSAPQMKLVEDANLPWKDSFRRDENGRVKAELYRGSGEGFTAINVYPQVGNYQFDFMMDQTRFLWDEVGMDGIYVDDSNQRERYSYEKWDGTTVDIDPRTGKITTKYTHCSLAGVAARRRVFEYALSRGKVVVANQGSVAAEMQSLPAFRFVEYPLHNFNPHHLKDGQKPPLLKHLYKAHLASPLCYGIGKRNLDTDKSNYARGFMKGIIVYLRHGLLYHHSGEQIPETGPGSGEYGPINHMFPITPVRLGEGFVIGKERTITCVSGNYEWPHPEKPTVLLFGLDGRRIEGKADLKRTRNTWSVHLRLNDWATIAVIEAP